jgi:uncharacterized membrane protein YfcA
MTIPCEACGTYYNVTAVSLVALLLGALAASGALLAVRWTLTTRSALAVSHRQLPTPSQVAIGFVTNFFDTLGIGSFATTTTIFRLLRMVPDEVIPGTMIIGHGLPVVTQALFFVSAVAVDPTQMVLLIAVCVAGGWFGAGVVASLSKRAIQIGMGTALLIAAGFMVLGLLGAFPAGGTALALPPGAFVIALVVNAVLGALVTLGIGNYAPSLVVFSLLGMEPRAAFPIMMGSGAFVATIAGVRFMNTGRFHSTAALGLTLGGIPGVIVAAWIVQSLPLDTLRWVVLLIVIYTGGTLLRTKN